MRVLVADRLRRDQPVAEACGECLHGARQRLRLRPLQIVGYGYAQAISSRMMTVAKDI
jgi:hypothetical protein